MPELRQLPIGQLYGDQESTESLVLADVFSSGGNRNLWIDKEGRATSILGYTKQNVAAVTSNASASAMRLRALFHYGLQSAGVLTRQEIGIFDDAAAHYEFRYSTDAGVTWTYVADLGAGSINTIPDFAQSGNVLIMTNGVLAPRQWDGTTLSVISNTQLAAPTITSGGAGQLNGNYLFRIVPIKSDGTRKNGSVTSVQFSAQLLKASVAWVADSDVSVTGYEVYRTTGTGKVLFFDGAVSGRTTVAYTSNTSDRDLIANRAMQEYGDAPPSGVYFCESHKQRTWYGRTDTYPRRWYYSDPGLPLSVYAENFIDTTDAESISDFSAGGTGSYQGMFVAWLERSIWTFSGDGTISGALTNWASRRTNAKIGTVSHRTVARIPAGAKYVNAQGTMQETSQVTLAYLTPLKDIRLFDGDNDTIISFAKADTLATMNYANRAKYFCVTDTQRGEVTWCFAENDNTEPTVGVTWNFRYGVWYTRDWPFAHAIEAESSSASSLLLAGEASLPIGGFCYKLWSGYTFNGTSIAAKFKSKTLYGKSNAFTDQFTEASMISLNKRWRWIDFIVRVSGPVTFTVEWWPSEIPDGTPAYGSVTMMVGTSLLETIDPTIIATADASSIYVIGSVSISRAQLVRNVGTVLGNRYMHSRGIRIGLRSNNDSTYWSLVGLNVGYQVLPGLQRTFVQ